MNQTNHFFDLGYGWLCKHCSAADSEAHQHQKARRFVNQAEPVKNKPTGPPFAAWTDPSRLSLICPRCGIEELIKNS